MYAARSMWGTSYQVAPLKMTVERRHARDPPVGPRTNPAGWFIQLFAATTENVPPMPASATGMPLSRCGHAARAAPSRRCRSR